MGKTTENLEMKATGQTGIHFTLGEAEDALEEPHVFSESHPLFCEMEELRRSKIDGSLEWKETARWIKFEEDVEDGGERWSKPFVATLSLQSLLELRTHLNQGSMLLSVDCATLPELCDIIVGDWIGRGLVQEYQRGQIRDILLLRHRHQFEGLRSHMSSLALRQLSDIGRSISHGLFNMTHSDLHTHASAAASGQNDMEDAERRRSSHGLFGGVPGNQSTSNLNISRKLPKNTESCTILVGEIEQAVRPLCALVRISNNVCLGNLTEVAVPTRFVFVLLCAVGETGKLREAGRAMGAMCSDQVFQKALYSASNRKDVVDAVETFMNGVTVLPPGEWDPQIRIEPPKSLPATDKRKTSPNGSVSAATPPEEQKEEIQIERTGRLFGGLIDDVKRKAPFYLSDFKDGFSLQCLASVIFLYFATLTPVVAFGALLGVHTGNNMAVMESILSAAVVGLLWAFFSGQPLTIMGSTGPVLVFESIVTTFCRDHELEYLPLRFWIGIWTGLFLFIMVATDASYLVRYITRFTEEGFAALISFIFIFESLEKLFGIRKTRNICTNTVYEIGNRSRSWCEKQGGTLVGPGCNYIPDVFLLSIVLFFGTFILSKKLKDFRNTSYFPAKVRQVISDFGVTAAIILMTGVDLYLGLDTPKLAVPRELTPTNPNRVSWLVHPFGSNPWWTSLAAVVPACFAVILIFMDQQITAVIVNRRENKLKKGFGYHLDLLVLTVTIFLCAILGLPWMVAATVLSINHVNSLKLESETRAPGESVQFTGIRENRLTTLGIYMLIGASCFMTPVLSRIPLPVLYGVFLFMGVSALRGLQFVDRLCLLLMPSKHQPDFIYLRHVPIKRVHLFTFIQTVCLAMLWILKSFDETSILFPLMVLALVGVRKLMDLIFRQSELAFLDDLMPESAMKKKEDDAKTFQEWKVPATSSPGQNGKSSGRETVHPHILTHRPGFTSKFQNWRRIKSEPVTAGDPEKEQQTRSLLPKLPKLILPVGDMITEEDEPQSTSPFPTITISPATPMSARSSRSNLQ